MKIQLSILLAVISTTTMAKEIVEFDCSESIINNKRVISTSTTHTSDSAVGSAIKDLNNSRIFSTLRLWDTKGSLNYYISQGYKVSEKYNNDIFTLIVDPDYIGAHKEKTVVSFDVQRDKSFRPILPTSMKIRSIEIMAQEAIYRCNLK